MIELSEYSTNISASELAEGFWCRRHIHISANVHKSLDIRSGIAKPQHYSGISLYQPKPCV